MFRWGKIGVVILKFVAYLRLKKLHAVLDETITDANVNVKKMQKYLRLWFNFGRKAIKILQDHYLGSSKPQIISLYSELKSLKFNGAEIITAYSLT